MTICQTVEVKGDTFRLLHVTLKDPKVKFEPPDLSEYGRVHVVEVDDCYAIYFRSHYSDQKKSAK